MRMTMRGLVAVVVMGAVCVGTVAGEKKREAPAARAAGTYAARDFHEKEHVTIAAEPFEDDMPFFRLPYASHGFLPVRIIITNDRDRALALDEVRIYFYTAANDKIAAATPEDIQRRLFSRKSQTTKIPLPAPLPSITIHHKPVDKKIDEDNEDFGFKSLVVEPHTTASGFLFFDVRDVQEPVLQAATIVVKQLKTQDGKEEMFGFEIPLTPEKKVEKR